MVHAFGACLWNIKISRLWIIHHALNYHSTNTVGTRHVEECVVWGSEMLPGGLAPLLSFMTVRLT